MPYLAQPIEASTSHSYTMTAELVSLIKTMVATNKPLLRVWRHVHERVTAKKRKTAKHRFFDTPMTALAIEQQHSFLAAAGLANKHLSRLVVRFAFMLSHLRLWLIRTFDPFHFAFCLFCLFANSSNQHFLSLPNKLVSETEFSLPS